MPEETPTASQSLATPPQLATFSQGKIAEDAAYVEEALAVASKVVRNLCGWHIAPSISQEFTRDGRGSSILTLPTLHLTAVDSVTLEGTALVEEVGFDWSENGVLERHPSWGRKRRGIVATITHGFDLGEIPEVVDFVCMLAARGLTAARARGVVREQAGTNSVTLGTIGGVAVSVDVLPHELARLKPYIIPEQS